MRMRICLGEKMNFGARYLKFCFEFVVTCKECERT